MLHGKELNVIKDGLIEVEVEVEVGDLREYEE